MLVVPTLSALSCTMLSAADADDAAIKVQLLILRCKYGASRRPGPTCLRVASVGGGPGTGWRLSYGHDGDREDELGRGRMFTIP